MTTGRHIVFVNEFFHPDICASAVVAADHLPTIAALRPDWKITILTGNRAWDDPTKVHPPREEYHGVQVVRVNRPAVSRTSLLWRGLGFAAFQQAAIRAGAKLGRIDLVVGTTAPPQGGRIAAKIARRTGCPYIYKVLDLYPDSAATLGVLKPGSLFHRRWLSVDTRTMEEAAAVVAISSCITERIARTRGIEAAKLHTIHDGYDAARLAFTGSSRFAAEHNPDGKFVVQYAGNMGLSHPLDTIVAAARQLTEDDRVLFQFIGDGPQRRLLEKALPPNARIIDYQPADRLGEIMASADMCLISQHEAMYDQALPYKIYAILAAGKPCVFIGDDRSEIAQWLRQSGAGYVVRQNQADALIEAIRACRNESRSQAVSQSAHSLFHRRFLSDESARKWVELLEARVASS
jgi:glycosyltransferase involved in cell wall biosynthesis